MKFLSRFFFVLLSISLIIGIIGFCFPKNLILIESETINKSTAEVYPLINNLDNAKKWMCFASQPPKNIQFKVGEPSVGVGAKGSWTIHSTSDSTSQGYIIITDSKINNKVSFNMYYNGSEKPFMVTYLITPNNEQSDINCEIKYDIGWNPYTRLVIQLYKKELIKDFKSGLINLRDMSMY